MHTTMKQNPSYLKKRKNFSAPSSRKTSASAVSAAQTNPETVSEFTPPCPLYRRCGGCQLQHMPYSQQLKYKQNKVERLLKSFHGVSPIIGMENPFHYRNKVQAAFRMDQKKKIISGVYQSSSHRIVPVDNCLIEDKIADSIIVTIRQLLKSFKLVPFDEDTGRGFLRHVLVKRGFSSGQIMVVLVSGSPIFPAKRRFVEALLKIHPDITTVLMNINPHHTSLVLGDREEILYGPGFIEDTLCGCTFRISAKSFYQINLVQTEILYTKAMEFAGLTGSETVIDAYCGIGTIGLIASRKAKYVIGIESNREAVRDAIANAKRNAIDNARFYVGDAGECMVQMAEEKMKVDLVFMDPPRAGSDLPFLSSVVTLAPKKIVYISCNPETQQRDLTYLTQHGYQVTAIQPVDMFPHTDHVETVVQIQKTGK